MKACPSVTEYMILPDLSSLISTLLDTNCSQVIVSNFTFCPLNIVSTNVLQLAMILYIVVSLSITLSKLSVVLNILTSIVL